MKWKRLLIIYILLFFGISLESEQIPVKEKPEFEISVYGIREKQEERIIRFTIYPRSERKRKIDSILNSIQ